MPQLNEFKEKGQRENYLIQFKLTKSQRERLIMLSEMEGHKTLSSYLRSRIFSDLSQQAKLDKILLLVQDSLQQTKMNAQLIVGV